MRRATHDVAFLIHEDGTTAGITLGFDFCAEHEFGVKVMKRSMGISGGLGVEGRTMTQQPAIVLFDTFQRPQRKKRGTRKAPAKDPAAALIVNAYQHYQPKPDEKIKDSLKSLCRDGLDFYAEPHDDWYKADRDQVAAAWDESGFAVLVRGAENVKRLEEIAQALAKNDIALADPSGMGFVDKRGLGVVIASRIPEAIRAKTLAGDKDAQALEKAAQNTGVAELLKKSGKGFYALSPSWTDDSKKEVKFFLNPAEQRKYNHGWYTVDELKAWARDEGPVVKTEDTPKPRKAGP